MKKIFFIAVLCLTATRSHCSELPQAIPTASPPTEENEEKMYEEAYNLYEQKSPKALRLLKKLSQAESSHIRANALIVLSGIYRDGLFGTKDEHMALKAALRAYDMVTDPSQKSHLAHFIADLYYTGGKNLHPDFDKAWQYSQNALSYGPNEEAKAQILIQSANIAWKQKNKTQATNLYHEVESQQADPTLSFTASQALGAIYKDEGKLLDAIKHFERAAQSPDPSTRGYAKKQLALLFLNGGPGVEKNVEKAQNYALEALQEAPYEKEESAGVCPTCIKKGLIALLRLTGYKGEIPVTLPAYQKITPKKLYKGV